MALSLASTSTVASQDATTLPPGFQDIPITEIYGSPTDFAWLGGDLLITAQEGWLYRLEGGSADAHPELLLDLSLHIGKGPEQGLLGVIADPEFASRPYLYLYYTEDLENGHCDLSPPRCRNRVSRFTMAPDGTLDPASEVSLLDTIMVGWMHNGGDIAFGDDGFLYVSTGDAGYPPDSQDLRNLNGKILRIDRDGQPAPGNPFANLDAASCQEAPRVSADQPPCPEIFAWGLRNPFRFAFDPNVDMSRFSINDVGQISWEEIDDGALGANYGWPEREGPCPNETLTGCSPSATFVEPIYAYSHETGCFAITGGAFVPQRSSWGAAYAGKYLFADWGCGTIFVLVMGEDGRYAASPFATGLTTIAPIAFSPDGSRLYYGREGGIVRAIATGP